MRQVAGSFDYGGTGSQGEEFVLGQFHFHAQGVAHGHLYQCFRYALDKPGVMCVLPGIRGKQDLLDVLSYLDATPTERDYSVVGTFAPPADKGACVYCNHCQPCPMDISIGLVNKYYDLARLGDALAADHYRELQGHASDCIHCGHCDARCPFGCAQGDRMTEIAQYFGI